MKYTGSCHCGAVKFDIDSEEIQWGMVCNCSHCRRKWVLLTFIPETQFHLISGQDNLSEYRFNKKVISHLFCKTCWVQAFWRGDGPGMTGTVAINIHCLDEVNEEALTIEHYNGKDI